MTGATGSMRSLVPTVRLLERLIRHIQHPPPWRWLCHRKLWQRVGPASPWDLPLELVQQLHWWLVIPLLRSRRPNPLNASLPWDMRLRACWLNSYQPRELAWWWAEGVRNWNELSRKTPDNLVKQIHRERRQKWPEQCQPALELLSNKAKLLALTPPGLRTPFLMLEVDSSATSTPEWWNDALREDGVVLKPLRGHAGRGVVRFKLNYQTLIQEGLFCKINHISTDGPGTKYENPKALHKLWQQITGNRERALAAPYVHHNQNLPKTKHSIVVRVLTKQKAPGKRINVAKAWLEIPLNNGLILFLNTNENHTIYPKINLNAEKSQELLQWKEYLKEGKFTDIKACLDAAKMIHGLLPPIDQVAWDWIPAKSGPVLLEGNGNFGLFLAEVFEYQERRK